MWELDYKESWVQKNWCFWTVVLEKTLDCPLDCEEFQPAHPKGYQPWIFIGRTHAEAEAPMLWPPDAKSWLIGKDPDAGKDWGQKEKGAAEDEMVRWHHWLNGHESEQTPRREWRMEEPGVLQSMGVTERWTWLRDWKTATTIFLDCTYVNIFPYVSDWLPSVWRSLGPSRLL